MLSTINDIVSFSKTTVPPPNFLSFDEAKAWANFGRPITPQDDDDYLTAAIFSFFFAWRFVGRLNLAKSTGSADPNLL